MKPARTLVALLCSSFALAQDRVPNIPQGGEPWNTATGVTRTEGGLHAAGPGYSARFTGGGIEFTPALGATALGRTGLHLRLVSIFRGRDLVPLGRAEEPLENGNLVHMAHGPDVGERFEVLAQGIEHSFMFARPLGREGDLVVRMEVTTDLAPDLRDGVRFRAGESGAVTIGGVTGIDADGRRAAGSSTYEAGILEYRLPHGFVSSATYPLTLDPLLGTVISVLPEASQPVASVDVAYDAASADYLIVWTRTLSATSSEIQAQRVAANGSLVGSLLVVQPSTIGVVFGHARVASVKAPDRLVVVYQVTPSTGAPEIRAKAVRGSDGAISQSSTLVASGAQRPDIGGRSAAGTLALVVWETATQNAIAAQFVSMPFSPVVTSPSLVGAAVLVANEKGMLHSKAAVTRQDGGVGRYLVTWQRTTSTGLISVSGRVLGGTTPSLLSPVTAVTTPSLPGNLAADCATGNGTSFLVVYENRALPGISCKVATFSATAGTLSLGAESTVHRVVAPTFPPGSTANAGDPAVDFADTRYLVVYSRETDQPASPPSFPNRVSNSALYLEEICPDACLLDDSPEVLAQGSVTRDSLGRTNGSSVGEPAVCAAFSGDSTTRNGDGLVASIRSVVTSVNTIPPQAIWTQGVQAQRVRALGVGGAVTTLAPGCGGGTASVSGPAVVANPFFEVRLTGMPAGTTAALLNVNAVVPRIQCGTCQILPFLITIPATGSGGSAALALPIPCDASLANGTLALQWTVIGTTTSPCTLLPNVALSNPISVTIVR